MSLCNHTQAAPFQPPGNVPVYGLALQYRLGLKQSLERSLINVRSRLKGKLLIWAVCMHGCTYLCEYAIEINIWSRVS